MRSERIDLGSERPEFGSNLGSGRPNLYKGYEGPNLGSERLDLASKRPDLGSERLYLRSERPDLGSGWPDFGSERPNLGLSGLIWGQKGVILVS